MVEQMPDDLLVALNRLFIRSVLELGNAGLNDVACRLAGEGWALLRHDNSREAERLNGVLHSLTRSHCNPQQLEQRRSTMDNGKVLDVRQLPPPQRHALIFDTYGKLDGGEGFILVNDHDPKPLYYQFQAERPGEVSWEYIERGPDVWRVRIGRQSAGAN
jgi:uncharacterized protein (DUF2249 family)